MSKVLPREIGDALSQYEALTKKAGFALTGVKVRISPLRIFIPTQIGDVRKDTYHFYCKVWSNKGKILTRKYAEYIDQEKGESKWQPQYKGIPIIYPSSFAHLKERIERECRRRHLPMVSPVAISEEEDEQDAVQVA